MKNNIVEGDVCIAVNNVYLCCCGNFGSKCLIVLRVKENNDIYIYIEEKTQV